MERRNAWFRGFCALALFGAALYGTTNAGATSPQGVMKQAIHWGVGDVGEWGT